MNLETIVRLAKTRGFIFPGSEIYGGLANSWDYGPLGVELKKNVKQTFWEYFIYARDDMVGLDAAILMNPKVWIASGHVANFSDPLVDCRSCKARARADKLIEEFSDDRPADWAAEKTPPESVQAFLMEKQIPCPSCGACDWTLPRQFNLMFETYQGVIKDESSVVYMRPETAQGIFVNFKNVERTTRRKLPFGIAQIGKAFRNEITPGNFTFRTREFEQMEIEYFFDPESTDWKELYDHWKQTVWTYITQVLGIKPDRLRFRDHASDELSHYSRGTVDVEYQFPFGWGELCAAAAYRTDYDLRNHMEQSGENLQYRDEESGRVFTPHVMEPSLGADRLALAALLDAYSEEEVEGETRTVLRFAPAIAPVKVAVLPLMKKDGLPEKAREIQKMLRHFGNIDMDITGSIGKRYRRQDEIGTPACVTVDYDTLEKGTVTVRDRDTMAQETLSITELPEYLRTKYFA